MGSNRGPKVLSRDTISKPLPTLLETLLVLLLDPLTQPTEAILWIAYLTLPGRPLLFPASLRQGPLVLLLLLLSLLTRWSFNIAYNTEMPTDKIRQL